MTRACGIVVCSLIVAGATACAPLNSSPRDAGAGAAGGGGAEGGGRSGGGGMLAGTGGVGIGGADAAGRNGGAAGAAGGPGAGGHAVATGGVPGTGGAVGNAGAAAGGRPGSGGAVGGGGAPAPGSGGSGAGGSPMMCVAPGFTCAMSTECCQTGDTAPTGATCLSDDHLCHAKCTSGSQCKSGCCAALTGQTYGACAATSFCPALKGVGDPCAANTECATGLCSGWCRGACDATNDLCLSTSSSAFNSQGNVNWCVLLTTGGYSCFPGCISSSDCAVYGTGLTCKPAMIVDGTTDYVCSQ
jgi:hypothetical protein